MGMGTIWSSLFRRRPTLRVDGGPHRQNEVAQGLGREVGPQIDGHGQGHRQLPPPPLPALLGQQGLDEHRRQVFRHRGVVAPGHRAQLVQRHQSHGDVERVEGLRRAVALIGLPVPHAQLHPGGGVAEIGVLPLLPPGRLVHIQDALRVGDGVAQFPQVDRQQGPEKGQRPRPVGHGVEYLQGNPVMVIEKADQPAVVLPIAHWLAGVLHILLDKGARGVVGLEVVPKRAPVDADAEAGEPGHGPVDGPLEGGRVHQLGHHGGKAVDGRVVLPLDGRVHQGGVVQRIPVLFLLFLPGQGGPLPSFSWNKSYHVRVLCTRRLFIRPGLC